MSKTLYQRETAYTTKLAQFLHSAAIHWDLAVPAFRWAVCRW